MTMTTCLTQQALESYLWGAATILRGLISRHRARATPCSRADWQQNGVQVGCRSVFYILLSGL